MREERSGERDKADKMRRATQKRSLSPLSLNLRSPFSRRCPYPQHLVLTFPAPVRLHALQLLAHEYKIAAAVDLAVAAPDGLGAALVRTPAAAAALGSPLTWRPLGRLAFDPNARSGHAARELKSVALGGLPAIALRLTCHAPHLNELNGGGQVGLVAVNAVGEDLNGAARAPLPPPAPAAEDGGHLVTGAPSPRPQAVAVAAAPVAVPPPAPVSAAPSPRAAGLASTSTSLTTALARLEAAKASAAAAEDYDAAAALKNAATALREVCGRLGDALAAQASAAVAEEYEAAKAAKATADGVRGEGLALVAGVEAGQWGEAAAAALAAVPAVQSPPPPPPPVSSSDPAPWSPPPPREAVAPASPPRPRPTLTQAALDERPLPAARARSASFDGSGDGDEADLGSTAVAAAAPAVVPPASVPTSTSDDAQAALAALVAATPPPPGWAADLPPPDPPRDEGAAKDAAPLAAAHGWFVASGLTSRSWGVREAAWGVVGGAQAGLSGGDREYARSLARAAAIAAARDRVPAVVAAALGAACAAVEISSSARDGAALAADVLPAAVDRLADANPRAGAAAGVALKRLAGASLRCAGAVLGALVKVGGVGTPAAVAAAAPRTLLARLAVLSELVPAVAGGGGEGTGPGSPSAAAPSTTSSSVDFEAVARFAIAAASSPSAPVRAAALGLAGVVGPVLPPGVGAACAPLAAAVNAKLRASLVRALMVEAVKPAAAPAGVVVRVDASGGAAPPPPPVPSSTLASQDPSVLEAELARREAAHGPSHPCVADALAGLAAVRAARGESEAAKALLTRAVAVYESATGPDSPDMAAALTDLAVLHLEAGDEGSGKPLLARALAIQSAALGAGHPDVMAIRDVLEAAAT